MSGQQRIPSTRDRRPLSVWELPKLAQSVHTFRASRTPKPKFRKHYAAILAFCFRNRLVICDQVRRRFPRFLKSGRTARRHLAEMESLGVLTVQPVTGVSPLMPKVYFVTGRGLTGLRRAYRERGQEWTPSATDRRRGAGQTFRHVWHELATTEFLLAVHELTQVRPDLELLATERRSLGKHPAFAVTVAGRRTRLLPDGLFLTRQSGGMMVHLVEIDAGTESERQLRTKFERYFVWSNSTAGREFLLDLYRRHGAAQPKPMFRLLLIASPKDANSEAREELLATVVKDLPTDVQERVWLSGLHCFLDNRFDPCLLERPLWRRRRHGVWHPDHSLFAPDL